MLAGRPASRLGIRSIPLDNKRPRACTEANCRSGTEPQSSDSNYFTEILATQVRPLPPPTCRSTSRIRSRMWRFVGTCEHLLTFRHMTKMPAHVRILQLAREHGSVTRHDIILAKIHTQALSRLVRAGQLERIAPGAYRLPDHAVTEHHSLTVVAAAAPQAVVCLLSALRFHQIGTQLPHAVWIAIDRRARPPALDYPPLRVVCFGGLAFSEGVETHHAEGWNIRVYSVAKTIADLFKYRNKIGLEVALEALRDSWQARRFAMPEIHRYARVCRVERVMTPYLEALAS